MSPCPFPTMITITPQAPPLYFTLYFRKCWISDSMKMYKISDSHKIHHMFSNIPIKYWLILCTADWVRSSNCYRFTSLLAFIPFSVLVFSFFRLFVLFWFFFVFCLFCFLFFGRGLTMEGSIYSLNSQLYLVWDSIQIPNVNPLFSCP